MAPAATCGSCCVTAHDHPGGRPAFRCGRRTRHDHPGARSQTRTVVPGGLEGWTKVSGMVCDVDYTNYGHCRGTRFEMVATYHGYRAGALERSCLRQGGSSPPVMPSFRTSAAATTTSLPKSPAAKGSAWHSTTSHSPSEPPAERPDYAPTLFREGTTQQCPSANIRNHSGVRAVSPQRRGTDACRTPSRCSPDGRN